MNIIGKIIIFKNDYGYSTNISKKNQDGSYDKMYIGVQLPKTADVDNKTYIDVKKGFISFYKDKNGLSKIKLVIMEFEQNEKEDDVYTSELSDLPF